MAVPNRHPEVPIEEDRIILQFLAETEVSRAELQAIGDRIDEALGTLVLVDQGSDSDFPEDSSERVFARTPSPESQTRRDQPNLSLQDFLDLKATLEEEAKEALAKYDEEIDDDKSVYSQDDQGFNRGRRFSIDPDHKEAERVELEFIQHPELGAQDQTRVDIEVDWHYQGWRSAFNSGYDRGYNDGIEGFTPDTQNQHDAALVNRIADIPYNRGFRNGYIDGYDSGFTNGSINRFEDEMARGGHVMPQRTASIWDYVVKGRGYGVNGKAIADWHVSNSAVLEDVRNTVKKQPAIDDDNDFIDEQPEFRHDTQAF